MIALLKVFKRTVSKEDGVSNVAGAYPYGIYENGELKYIGENSVTLFFPNSGKIFVPNTYPYPQNECFKLCELVEATYFEDNNPKFAKYSLDKDVPNIDIYEVIDLDETIENDKSSIADLLTKGIFIPFIPSDIILFRTADDYLIGPLKLEFDNGKYICKDTEFVGYYQQDLSITMILDYYKNQERLFCLEQPKAENLIGWIDVANEQRVISDALKQLKENEEFGELSRKITSRLKEIYSANNAKKPHLQERLKRAIHLIESHTLDGDTTLLYIKLFLELEASQNIISQRVKNLFETEYEKFTQQNEKLLKQITVYQQQLQEIEKQTVVKETALTLANAQLNTIHETMSQKIRDMQIDFAQVYAEQLATTALPVAQLAVPPTKVPISKVAFAKWNSLEGKNITDLNEFANLLERNLSIFRGNDEEGTLAATVFSAVLLGEPILIYGEYSLELAKCIAKTISCTQTLTLIPELETFTLTELQSQYCYFTSVDAIKSLIIHNPHVTSALYSLPTYLKEQKWHDEELIPNLTIITLESLAEAMAFVKKMPNSPLIDSAMYMKRSVHRQSFKALTAGQLDLRSLGDAITDDTSFAIRRQFREWIEDTKDVEVEIPIAFVTWLQQLSSFLEMEEQLFEWVYKVFKQSIQLSEDSGVEVH